MGTCRSLKWSIRFFGPIKKFFEVSILGYATLSEIPSYEAKLYKNFRTFAVVSPDRTLPLFSEADSGKNWKCLGLGRLRGLLLPSFYNFASNEIDFTHLTTNQIKVNGNGSPECAKANLNKCEDTSHENLTYSMAQRDEGIKKLICR